MSGEILSLINNADKNIRPVLIEKINDLINNDLNQLYTVLYRLDISEKKLKHVLADQQANAAELIADLIIQRQIEKSEARQQFKQNHDNISEEERW